MAICLGCNGEFTPYYDTHRYCSRPCWLGRYNREDREHTMRGATNGSKAIGDKTRGTGTKGYIKRNGRHEHRIVAEESLGRSLAPGEVVHHIDGDKHNNDPRNLQVFASQAEHAAHHSRDASW